MLVSNKIHDNVLHLNFAPSYTFDVENNNDIVNTSYSFQFLGNSTKDLKEEHLLAYNNNYVSESFSISEWNLYGSSRLGARNIDKVADVVFLASRNYNWINSTVTNEYIAPTASFTYKKYRLLGAKTFELTNHLGNVISTISDRKLMVEDQQNIGFVHHYKPEILSIGEQYAFGMSMPGRTFSVEDYRYGFNGKENQDELLGEDNSQDFGARMYDGRVGRWWGLDPLRAKYPSVSPYAFCANSPILYLDKDGRDFEIYIDHNIQTIMIRADIYTNNGNDESLAIEGVKQWLSLNGNYKYKVGKGDEKVFYDIKFELNVYCDNDKKLTMYENFQGGPDDSRATYPIANTFRMTNDQFYYNKKKDLGNVSYGRRSVARTNSAYVVSHEFGHLMGLNHFNNGLMKESYHYGDRDFGLHEVKNLLNNQGIGRLNLFQFRNQETEGSIAVGKGIIKHIGNKPKDFDKGKVVRESEGRAKSVRKLDYDKK
jgi:RHS repeat-associated protein